MRSNKALVLSPFANNGLGNWDESPEVSLLLLNSGFDVTYKTTIASQSTPGGITINDFKDLHQYGAISIVTHGDRFQAGTDGLPILDEASLPILQSRGGFNPDGTNADESGVIVLYTGIRAEISDFIDGQYNQDFLQKRLIPVRLGNDEEAPIYVGITPAFISTYSGSFPNSFIYIGACSGLENNTMSSVFLGNGAGGFVGYSRPVTEQFGYTHGIAMFKALAHDLTIREIPGLLSFSTTPSYDLFGAKLRLASTGFADLTTNISLRNGGFEIGSMSGWATQGNTSSVANLGSITAPGGGKMALISTGGYDGSFSQTFFVPVNADKLLFRYNLISEEPMEYVGTQYDDQFDVLINRIQEQSMTNEPTTVIETARINTATWLPISGIDFSGGDSTTFQTGFKEVIFDLSSYRGSQVKLTFKVYDKGDNIYETVSVIDDVLIATVPYSLMPG